MTFVYIGIGILIGICIMAVIQRVRAEKGEKEG